MSARPVQLEAVARADRFTALEAAEQALSAAGVSLLDVHLYSDLSACLVLELPAAAGPALATALETRGLRLDEASRSRLAGLAEEGPAPLPGTLALRFAGGRGDLRRETPAVPG